MSLTTPLTTTVQSIKVTGVLLVCLSQYFDWNYGMLRGSGGTRMEIGGVYSLRNVKMRRAANDTFEGKMWEAKVLKIDPEGNGKGNTAFENLLEYVFLDLTFWSFPDNLLVQTQGEMGRETPCQIFLQSQQEYLRS